MKGAIYGIWTWFAFAVLSIVGYIISLFLFLLTFAFDRNRFLTGRAIRYSGRAMCAAVPMWKFVVEGPLPQRLPERAVCVSNHCSNIDPFLLAHLPFEMKFLAKSTLFQIPCVGWGMKIAGDIGLVRGSSSSVRRAMAKAAAYVKRGMPVLIFPEGTRSKTGEMLPFKDGAFRLAIENGAAIVPIAVAGTVGALRKGDWKPGVARGGCIIGEPIDTSSMSVADLKQLKELTKARIEELRTTLHARGYIG